MGKRSRSRAQATTGDKRPRAARPPAARQSRQRLDPTRRALTIYVAGAFVVAVTTLLGIVVLGGTLGPFIVLAVVVVAAGLIHRAASARLRGQSLTGEDRMMQTMAGGMLVLSVVLAAAGAVVSTLA